MIPNMQREEVVAQVSPWGIKNPFDVFEMLARRRRALLHLLSKE